MPRALTSLACVLAALLAGCVIVPLDNSPSQGYVTPATQSMLMGRTRADVLLALGPPEVRSDGDRVFGYRWDEAVAGIVLLTAGGVWGDTIDRHQMLLLGFDADGVVQRMEILGAMTKRGLDEVVREWARK